MTPASKIFVCVECIQRGRRRNNLSWNTEKPCARWFLGIYAPRKVLCKFFVFSSQNMPGERRRVRRNAEISGISAFGTIAPSYLVKIFVKTVTTNGSKSDCLRALDAAISLHSSGALPCFIASPWSPVSTTSRSIDGQPGLEKDSWINSTTCMLRLHPARRCSGSPVLCLITAS